MKFKKTVLTGLLALSLNANAGIPVTDVVGNLQMALGYIEDIAQTVGQITQIQNEVEGLFNQVEQIDNQIKQLKNLENYTWQDVEGILAAIESATNNAEAMLANSDLTEQYNEYRNAEYYSDVEKLSEVSIAAEDRWNVNAEANADVLGKKINLQHDDIQADSVDLTELQSASSGVEGDVQAIQAGNQIAALNVKQLMQVRHLLIATQEMGLQVRKEEIERRTMQEQADRRAGFRTEDTPSKNYAP